MKDGNSSSFPITRLSATYKKQMSDGRLLSLRPTIELVLTRIGQLLERVNVDEAPERVALLHDLWNEFKEYEPGTTDYIVTKKKIDIAFEKVFHDYAAWKQLFEAADLHGKMVEREAKILTSIKAVMTAKDGYELVAKLMAAMTRVLEDDPKKMKQVQYEFSRIIGESSDLTTEANGADDWGDSETSGGEEGFGDVDKAELLYPGNQE